ncbi:MAG: hypothetical protein HZB14_03500 [Actinobacteria bacterium]|nr:hypothetical protein [Actinomycetota bacterium]
MRRTSPPQDEYLLGLSDAGREFKFSVLSDGNVRITFLDESAICLVDRSGEVLPPPIS